MKKRSGSSQRCSSYVSLIVLMATVSLLSSSCGSSSVVTPTPAPQAQLLLVNSDGFGNANNVGVGRLFAAAGYLFVGTWNTVDGTEIYRSSDGLHFQLISSRGLNGDISNFVVTGFAWFNAKLYVGTWNPATGGNMFRANADAANASDIVWETISTDGFGNFQNQGFTHLHTFNNHLYCGCFNLNEGTEVWRSSSGDPGSWTMVIPKGFGQPAVVSDSTYMLDYGGYLYVGTETAGAIINPPNVGTQLWRTDGNLSPPYDQWQQVNTNGFGNDKNHNICGLGALHGQIYAGTWNMTQGLEVWRATPSDTIPFPGWEKVNQNGFGNPAVNIATNSIVVYNGTLYLCGLGAGGKGSGLLVKTTDGTTWTQITGPGFNVAPVDGFQWLEAFKGNIYVGAHCGTAPLQLWVYEPST